MKTVDKTGALTCDVLEDDLNVSDVHSVWCENWTPYLKIGRIYAQLVQIRLERGRSEANAMPLVLFVLFFFGVPFLHSGLKCPRL